MSLLIAKNMKTKCGLGVHAKSVFLFNWSNISRLGTRNIFNGLAYSQGTVCVYTALPKVDWKLIGMDSPWAGRDLAWIKHA